MLSMLLQHIISQHGIMADPDKIYTLCFAPTPLNVNKSCVFLARSNGIASCYLVHIAIPLYHLTHSNGQLRIGFYRFLGILSPENHKFC